MDDWLGFIPGEGVNLKPYIRFVFKDGAAVDYGLHTEIDEVKIYPNKEDADWISFRLQTYENQKRKIRNSSACQGVVQRRRVV